MFMIANPEPRDCKICSGPSPLFGVIDFHKSCIEAQGNRLPLSGRPIYYRRCTICGFAFTEEFDDWSAEAFLAHIYNSSYIHVDPDYASARPLSNATAIANTFLASRESIAILDFGGGTECSPAISLHKASAQQPTIRFPDSTSAHRAASTSSPASK
jgi:hypothetical protein